MSIFKAGPCGGEGGQPFSMDNPDKITSIVKIGVYYSTYISAITITYIDVDNNEKTVTWGEPRGTFGQIIIPPGGYITSVNGYYGRTSDDNFNCLRALAFDGRGTTHGPYEFGIKEGAEFEAEFKLPAVTNNKIIAFHGRSGTRLDALGVYIKVDDIDGSTGTGQYRNI